MFYRSLLWYTSGLAKDALEAFKEAENTAKLVKAALEKEHAKRQHKTLKGPVTYFKVGGHVWAERPRPLDTSQTETWYTPGKIAKRIGHSSKHLSDPDGPLSIQNPAQDPVEGPCSRNHGESRGIAMSPT